MPGEKQGTTFDLKHRLTGAAILIGFAVIVLPLLLGGPEVTGDGDNPGAEPDTKVFRSNITPIGGPTPPVQERPAEVQSAEAPPPVDEDAAQPRTTADTAEDGTQEEGAEVATAPTEPAADESEEPGTEPETAPEADSGGGDEPAVAPAETVERGWIVQVGTFRDPDNVEKLVAELQNNGFGTSTTDVETTEGSATRVWVGPYETRVEAARIKTRVKQRVGSEGLIVAYP